MPVSPTPFSAPSRLNTVLGVGKPAPKSLEGIKEGEDLEMFFTRKKKEGEEKAKYKIEVMFSSHRSSLAHKPSPCMVIMWESGKRFHGGGDQKLYWCGYDKCDKPISSDNFAYQHVVCPHCLKEQFLDGGAKAAHIKAAKSAGDDIRGLHAMPLVVGERMANLVPGDLATFLAITWRKLGCNADVYLKFSPLEIRYDISTESAKDIDNLTAVREGRKPVIYSLKNIVRDTSAGADLSKRFLSLITC